MLPKRFGGPRPTAAEREQQAVDAAARGAAAVQRDIAYAAEHEAVHVRMGEAAGGGDPRPFFGVGRLGRRPAKRARGAPLRPALPPRLRFLRLCVQA